jgi:hypothetical protein
MGEAMKSRPVVLDVNPIPHTRDTFENIISWLESRTTKDEAQQFLLHVNHDLAAVKSEIALAVRTAAASGVYRDPVWFRKMEGVQRYLGRLTQRTQLEISRIGKEEKARNVQANEAKTSRNFERMFMIIAKERLSPAAYDEILQETKRREVR